MDLSSSTLKLRGGLTLYPSQIQAIEKLMDDLVEKLPAPFAFLVEGSGQTISFVGKRWSNGKEIDVTALGALVAADMAASQEIARLTGEYQAYQLVLRQGETASTFISEVGKSMALLVQVSRDVPMGWARIHIIETAQKIADAVMRVNVDDESKLEILDDNLQELLNSSLDSMWSEDSDVR